MKKIFFLAACVLVIGAVVWLSFGNSKKEEAVTPAKYRLIVIAGDVTLAKVGSEKSQVASEAEVATGDQITTSATGRARLRWPNGTLTTLEENTTITIQELSNDGAQSRIELIAGDMWSRVTRILGSGEHYEVQTQDTVAAVRGTLFRTTYRNRQARVQTLESTVAVFERRGDGSTDESSKVEVSEDAQADFDGASPSRRLAVRKMNAAELSDGVLQRIRKERDLDDVKVRSSDVTTSPLQSIVPSASPSLSPSVSVRASPKIAPTQTPVPTSTLTPTVPQTPTPTPTPTSTPAPSLDVSLHNVLPSILPAALGTARPFAIQGTNFVSGRNISQIAGVSVGGLAVLEFGVIDAEDIIATAPQLGPGVYDVTVTTKAGAVLTLKSALTIE